VNRSARFTALLTSSLAVALAASGQAQTPRRPDTVLRVQGAERPVEVASLDVRVLIHGLHAETTQTLVFRNPNDRVLEGELQLPLPDGATVNGYAIDVGGKLADAVVVTKEKARVVLETEIRRGVDPGLVEQVRGNLYRTRIYPIPARGTRTVRLSWVSELATRGDAAAYQLPLPWQQAIPEVSLRIEVVQGEVAPELSGGFGAVVAKRWTDRWVAEGRWRAAGSTGDLLVRVPNLPARLVHVEPGVESGPGAEAFFAITDRVPERPSKAAAPARVAIAWDASGSREREATERELAFLDRLLAAWPATAFDVVVFRDTAEKPVRFDGRDGRGRLAAALRQAPRDGGTALATLSFARGALPDAADALWLLFSDGVGTLGEAPPVLGDVPVWTVTAATVADRAFLRHASRSTGGELLDLSLMDPAAAAAAVSAPGVRLVGATAAAADLQILERADRTRAIVVGRLTAPEADVTLAYGDGAGIVERRTVRVRRADAVQVGDGPGPIATAWAQAKVELLGLFPERNADELLSMGRRFGLVTAGTSLLVLETLAQHLEHEVEPSPARPELREQYLAAVAGREKTKRQTEQGQLDRVAGLWEARRAWWKEDHSVPPGWRWEEEGKQKAAEGQLGARRSRAAEPEAGDALTERLAPAMAPAPASAPLGGLGLLGTGAGGGGGGAMKKAMADEAPGVEAQIVIKPWDPKTPWTEALRRSAPRALYDTYLGQRQVHASPAFFLDCAGFFLRANERALGLRILSNLAELRIDDPAMLRVFAWRLQEAGALEEAVEVLTKVLRLRPEDGQSKRDLALALGELGEARGRAADVAKAVELLYAVVRMPDQRTAEIELIALMELNRLAARAERRGWGDPGKAAKIDARLRGNLDLDLRVSLSWDADNTDVDLHLFEPTGEHAFYGHAQTRIGGLVSRDITNGYGPEEYVIRRAVPGQYAVKAHYYGSGQQTLVGPATLTATVFTNWGRADEKRQVLTLRLESPREMEEIGAVTIGGTAKGR
jgi:tetratricopeptide (TPR) repeat protein